MKCHNFPLIVQNNQVVNQASRTTWCISVCNWRSSRSGTWSWAFRMWNKQIHNSRNVVYCRNAHWNSWFSLKSIYNSDDWVTLKMLLIFRNINDIHGDEVAILRVCSMQYFVSRLDKMISFSHICIYRGQAKPFESWTILHELSYRRRDTWGSLGPGHPPRSSRISASSSRSSRRPCSRTGINLILY